MRYSSSRRTGRAITNPPLHGSYTPLPNGGPHRIPVVGIMGSGTHPHIHLAQPLGRALAWMRVHLLTGGGGGVMEAASRAFFGVAARSGLVIGILPAADASWGPGRCRPRYTVRISQPLGGTCHPHPPGRPHGRRHWCSVAQPPEHPHLGCGRRPPGIRRNGV